MINSPIEEIRNRLDIVDLVREYVKLEKAGVNYRALCPFHSEKTPSFFVNPVRQRWHCFGSCSEGGDIFSFVMKIEGVEFADALRILAAKTGVELKKQDPKIRSERQRVYEICEWANRFYEDKIKSRSDVTDYLKKRGIGQDEIKLWRIGYAPDSWDDLIIFLRDKGYSGEEVMQAGLAGRREGSSKHYNRFRGRIIFPIFDFSSQPIGFGGRLFEEDGKKRDEAKYLNTPNTILYNKSKVLYGLDKAKIDIRKNDFCILTEGYTDVIMSHKAGLTNTVSTSGTALTEDQLAVIKRYSDNLVTAFDMDEAGGSATDKGVDMAIAQGFNVKVASLLPGLDPADMILKNPEDWIRSVKESISIMDFRFERAFSDKDPSDPEDRKKIASELLPKIAIIFNDIERGSWVQKLAHRLGVREEDVLSEMGKIKKDEPYRSHSPAPKITRSREELIEERLLMIFSTHSELLKEFTEEELLSEKGQRIIKALKSNETKGEEKEVIDFLIMKMEVEEIDIDIEEDFNQCWNELRSVVLKKKLKEISNKIREAEAKRDDLKIEELTKEFNVITQSLSNR